MPVLLGTILSQLWKVGTELSKGDAVMTRYVLNSAVLTAPGRYSYRLVTEDEARAWLAAGPWTSRIGYPATAEEVSRLAGGAPCPLSREPHRMEPGDEALVVRLPYRLPDPGVKSEHIPAGWEYGILIREG